jgi:hypothetical protein
MAMLNNQMVHMADSVVSDENQMFIILGIHGMMDPDWLLFVACVETTNKIRAGIGTEGKGYSNAR